MNFLLTERSCNMKIQKSLNCEENCQDTKKWEDVGSVEQFIQMLNSDEISQDNHYFRII